MQVGFKNTKTAKFEFLLNELKKKFSCETEIGNI